MPFNKPRINKKSNVSAAEEGGYHERAEATQMKKKNGFSKAATLVL